MYLLLKSSDFVSHGVGPRAYEGTEDETDTTASTRPRLELVLKKYDDNMNPAREVRCFVRDNILIGRDLNCKRTHTQAFRNAI